MQAAMTTWPIESLEVSIAAFKRDNPAFIAALDLFGMQVADYHRLLAENEPPVIVTDNTGGYPS